MVLLRLQAIRSSQCGRLVPGREAGLAPAPVRAVVPVSPPRLLKRALAARVRSNRAALRRAPEARDREVLPVVRGDLVHLAVLRGRWDQMRLTPFSLSAQVPVRVVPELPLSLQQALADQESEQLPQQDRADQESEQLPQQDRADQEWPLSLQPDPVVPE